MNSIELMMLEHGNIKRMLKIVRIFCRKLYDKEEVNFDDFEKMIYFIKNYADKHHHGKEERLLFNRMVKYLGPAAQKLVTHGMLVEHDMGRLFMSELGIALDNYKMGDIDSVLDIIANAISYTHLLERHINKENELVYTFAQRNLSLKIMSEIDSDCEKFEEDAESNGVQQRCLSILDDMERKYLGLDDRMDFGEFESIF